MCGVYRTADGEALALGKRLGGGGESDVHGVTGDPKRCVKIYHNPDEVDWRKTEAMVGHMPSSLSRQLAWPLGIVLDDAGRPVGVWMRRIVGQPLITVYQPVETTKRATRRQRLRLAIQIAALFESLHRRNIVVGDVNEENFLVDARRRHVFAVDCCSMQIPDVTSGGYFRCRVGRGEYTAPELMGVALDSVDRTAAHDAFSLAVLLYRLLSPDGAHPFECNWRGRGDKPTLPQRMKKGWWPHAKARAKNCLPPANSCFAAFPAGLQECFRGTFDAGHADPSARTTPDQWLRSLRQVHAWQLPRSPQGVPLWHGILGDAVRWRERLRPLWEGVRRMLQRPDGDAKMNVYRFVGGASLAAALFGMPVLYVLSHGQNRAARPNEATVETAAVDTPASETPTLPPYRPNRPSMVEQEPRRYYGGEMTPKLLQGLLESADMRADQRLE